MDEESVSRDIIEKHNQRQKRLDRLTRWLAAVASMAAAVGLGFTLLSEWSVFKTNTTLDSTIADARVRQILAEVEILKVQVQNLKSSTPLPGNITPASIEAGQLSADVKGIGERLSTIESAISSSPERALAVPLLRKDVDALRDTVGAHSAETARQVDRIYDQNKWFIGVLFTLALAIIGLVINSFLKAR